MSDLHSQSHVVDNMGMLASALYMQSSNNKEKV